MKIEDFGPITLSRGAHKSPREGMCFMEMVSFLAGAEWSDMPDCSSPVVARFCQRINDNFPQEDRDQLQRYVPRLIGTASPEHEQERAEYLAWSAIRVFAPAVLEKCGLTALSEELRDFQGTLGEAKKEIDIIISATRVLPIETASIAAELAASNDAECAAIFAADAARGLEPALIFEVLDGLLEIGPSGTDYTQAQIKRVPALIEAIA